MHCVNLSLKCCCAVDVLRPQLFICLFKIMFLFDGDVPLNLHSLDIFWTIIYPRL